jgi:PKD repeat protein
MARPLSVHRFAVALLGLALAVSGCTTHNQDAPPLSGPSELGTAITITVSPDVVTQDGVSQSLVQITARDNNGQPLRNLALRAELAVNGVGVDFGTLSARSLVTDANGRASLTFTAPPAPGGVAPATDVQVLVTPLGTDFANATPRFVTIHVVPAGTTVPPRGSVTPKFTVTPAAPSLGDVALFDATQSTSTTGTIVQWLWNFGDGATASGETVQHTFRADGTFPVTLTVIDSIGASNSLTQNITVGQGQGPIPPTSGPTFVFSPSSPIIGQQVSFNAAGWRAAAGHSLRSFQWDFGDGTTGTGQTITHAFTANQTFNVILTVTDDVGRFTTVTQPVNVGNGNPTADFAFNPSAPRAGQQVVFDGGASQAAPGRTITQFSWSFGDGGSAQGQTVTHTFSLSTPGVAQTFNVLLTVTDSAGRTNSITKPITINP